MHNPALKVLSRATVFIEWPLTIVANAYLGISYQFPLNRFYNDCG